MKKIVLTVLFSCLVVALFAQTGTVRATLIDDQTKEGVVGAVVTITSKAHPTQKKHLTSGYKGLITMPVLSYGDYTITVSFIGYNELTKTFKVSAAQQNLGVLALVQAATQISTVVKEAKSLRASQKGDTLSYNAGAFKVTNDADVEGLLKKMPGITVSNGTVEAQGETVKKIFVDGKEFFGDDVSTAIKSLPAEAVNRIEVYNKLSDAAEFSGMDDGEGFKALNIVTHSNMRQGKFGKMYATYGYDADTKTEVRNKYDIGGNVNVFNGDSRISLLALFNNVNKQNFDFEDILGVTGRTGGGRGAGQYMTRPQDGVASVNALGVNYSDTWGKRKQVTFQGSYFFNNAKTTNQTAVDKWYEFPHIDTLSTEGYSKTKNNNHRFNGRLEWKISDNQNLMIRPSFSYQSNDPYSTTFGQQFGQSGYSLIDNYRDGLNSGYNARLTAVYRAKLGKNGRTITIDGTGRYQNNENSAYSFSNTKPISQIRPSFDPETGEVLNPDEYLDLRYLYSGTPSSSYSVNGSMTYTEPVAKYAQLSLQYRANYNYQERDKKSYVTGDAYDITGLTPDPSLSNRYSSGYLTHNIGPGFRYAKNKNVLIANFYYQNSTLDGMVDNAAAEKIKHSYNNFTYFLMGQFNINRANSIRLFVQSNTQNPSVTDLQSVYDVSNAQYISSGNPNLNPSYSQMVRFHYINSNIEKGRTFMWMFSVQNISDVITSDVAYNGSVEIDKVKYNYLQYSHPVNMDGYWSFRTFLNYGLPIGFLKCNFNIGGGVRYSVSPSRINGERNQAENMGYDLRTVLGSNISENIDFTVQWNGTYNVAKNSLAAGRNEYFNHTAQGEMRFVFWKGFTFSATAIYTQYKGITNNYNESYILCSAALGKKLFKNRRGEVSVGVNDIFNQNLGFGRTTGSGYTQNTTNSVIGRYYLVKFVYNLRMFGKKGSKNLKDYENVETPGRGGGMRLPAGHPPIRGGMGGGMGGHRF